MQIRFSVSTLNVLVAVVSIIITAGATLGITLYFSIDSANKMATSSVEVMADKARDQMIAFVNQPVAAAISSQYMVTMGDSAEYMRLPSEIWRQDPRWNVRWEMLQAQYLRQSYFKFQYVTMGWDDGFYVGCKLLPDNETLFQCRSYSRENATTEYSTMLERNFTRESGAVVGEATIEGSLYDPRRREWFHMMNQPDQRNWSSVYLSSMPTLPVIDLTASLTNSSGYFLGVIGFSYELKQLDEELKRISPMQGGSVVLLDNQRHILGSSTHHETYDRAQVPRGYALTEEEANRGCSVSDELTATLSVRVCQHSIETFGLAELRALAARHPHLLTPPTKAETLYVPTPNDPRPETRVVLDTLAGTRYYAAVIALSTSYASNMNWLVISLLPEEAVTASIIKGRDVAIGVAVALVVVIAVLVGIAVKVMLNPLSLIAARMETAAYLRVRGGGARGGGGNAKGESTSSGDERKEDDDDEIDIGASNMHERLREKAQAAEDALLKERKLSYLSDVAAIQNAYWDMADELWAMKGYIPEHVTKAVVAKIAMRRAEAANGGSAAGGSADGLGGSQGMATGSDGGASVHNEGGGVGGGIKAAVRRATLRRGSNDSVDQQRGERHNSNNNNNTNTNNTATKGTRRDTSTSSNKQAGRSKGSDELAALATSGAVDPANNMNTTMLMAANASNGINEANLQALQRLSTEAVIAEHVPLRGKTNNNKTAASAAAQNPMSAGSQQQLHQQPELRSSGGAATGSDPISSALPFFAPPASPAAAAAAGEFISVVGPTGSTPKGAAIAFPQQHQLDKYAGADNATKMRATTLPYTGGDGGDAFGDNHQETAHHHSGDGPGTVALQVEGGAFDGCGNGSPAAAAAEGGGGNNTAFTLNSIKNSDVGGGGEMGATVNSSEAGMIAAAKGLGGLSGPKRQPFNKTSYNNELNSNASPTSANGNPYPFHGSVHSALGGRNTLGSYTYSDAAGGDDFDQRMLATLGSAENVSVAAIRIAGLGRVEEDVPIFFGDNVLVDRDVTIVHINVVNFHKYCRVTHGKDLKREHEVLVNLVYAAARKCGGVLDTFSGDKFFVSFNAASKCLDHPVAALCFAHEVSSIVTKDAIWGAQRRKIEQHCHMNNIPIPPDSKAFPPHVYKAAPFGITCGVATGRAFVGPLGSDRVLRHSVLSNAMTEAVALERLCLKYPACRILIAGDLITMVDAYFSYQLLDAAVLPGTGGKRRRLASVKGPLRRSDLSVFKGGCRGMAARSRVRNIYCDMNDCFLAFLEGRAENSRASLMAVDVFIDAESRRLQAAAAEAAEAAAARAGSGKGGDTNSDILEVSGGAVLTTATATPTSACSNAGGPVGGEDAPINDEECADLVIMSQFIWSLLQCEPPLDGRLYRSPLGETYQPVQHALYLVPPPNNTPMPMAITAPPPAAVAVQPPPAASKVK